MAVIAALSFLIAAVMGVYGFGGVDSSFTTHAQGACLAGMAVFSFTSTAGLLLGCRPSRRR